MEVGGSAQDARKRAMNAFALADRDLLTSVWSDFEEGLRPALLRGPEIGLVMLRGRIGGGGAPFNVGEASVARASVRAAPGTIGHAMVLGRDGERARLAACFDAAWQVDAHRTEIETRVIAPTLAAKAERDRRSAEEAAATKVDFFTMARGED